MITKESLREALPTHLKSAASDDLVNKINAISQDPEEARVLRENIVTYGSVLTEGRFTIDQYLEAVTYVTHKIMGCSNQAAWKKTFPTRYQALVAKNATEKEISAYVAAYNKNKLVNLVLEQTIIPTWVLNQDAYQEAINTQFRLMTTAASEKVQCEAANSILTHLKRPETKKVEIDLGVRDNSGMDQLKEMMTVLASRQREMIEQGINTREIAHQPLPRTMKNVTPEDDV